jgi:hypothetical protein
VNCKRIGDSVYVSVKIVNTGNLAVDQIPLRLQINGGNDITETVNHYLASGDSIVYAFTKAYIVPTVSDIQPYYNVRLKSELPCDVNASNNEINLLACVNLDDMVDLSIQSINKPLPSVCDSGLSVIKVSVTLANLGDNDISSAAINVKVDSAGHAWASFSETTDTIIAKGSLVHVCTNTYVVPNFSGNYTVNVYLDSITADEKLSNDTATVTACAIYKNIVGIDLINKIDWSLGQNIPNPVTTITQIPYSIPQQGSLNFSVMTITGQVLYAKTIQSMAGDYSITFDTQSLADGIYYYSMEYEGQRIVRKMTIQR